MGTCARNPLPKNMAAGTTWQGLLRREDESDIGSQPLALDPVTERERGRDKMERETNKLADKPTTVATKVVGKSPSLVIGVVMIVLGALFFIAQLLDVSLGRYLWPLWVLVPGAIVLLIGCMSRGGAGEAMCIVGSIISMVGLLLMVQNATGTFQTWAYAWALVGPTSPGIGLWLHGTLKGNAENAKSGRELIRIGLTMFLIAGIFFELVIGISGFGLGRLGLPILLIALGVVFLARNLFGMPRRKE